MQKLTITRIIPLFLLLMISTVSAFSQYGEPKAILAYAADEFEVEIVDGSGTIITDIYSGMELSEGDTIRTNETVAELSLDPNGSIIKLSPNTVFTIRQLQRSDDSSNDFHMVAGKLRTIAARGSLGAKYRISTPSAVSGVRGTDFGVISIPGSEEKAFVIDGLIDYSNAAGQTISLSSGQIADALAASFEAFQASQEQLQQLIQDVVFEQLDPSLVPGHTPEVEEPEVEAEEPEEEPEAEEAGSEEEVLAEDDTEDEPADVDTVQDEPVESAESGSAGGDGEAGPLGKLGEMLGLEIGTVTIDGLTYSKAVLQPVFETGKLRVALYLPIIYSKDLFDPNDWYSPRGNDEWSFGSDQDWEGDPLTAAGDLASDLFLKLRYLEYGGNRDPFYLRLGNLRTMTVGHGILMRNYANDFDFPAIRRLGVNTGVKGNKLGFEAVVNDLSVPEVFGGRLVWRPMGMDFPLGFGVSGIIDINPDSMSDPATTSTMPDDIMLLGTALDMELPVMENSVLSIVFFGDSAAMLPVIGGTPQIEAIYDSSAGSFSEAMRNYGLESGVFGNVLFVDYRLSYRYYQGSFRPTLFGPSYERLRGIYAIEAYEYLQNPSSTDNDKVVMGVYGEAGADILKLFRLEAGYLWPWSPSGANVEEDSLNITLTVFPDVIPVLGVYGSITYSRTKFLPMLTGNSDEDLRFLDAYAAFSGEIVYPLAPNLDIVLAAGTALKYEGSEPVFNSDGTPKMVPNFTLETRVHF